jgi:HD-GYP domain-containing protein (c-di-GMP phosphodiesterase class II)
MPVYSSNRHCVEKLLNLSESHSIVATEDIYDEQGMKLLARGAEISRAMQDRLLLRKLRAPLESSLAVQDGLTFAEMMQGALDLIGEIPALECVAGGRAAREILRDGRAVRIPQPLLMLMTCARHADPDSYRRALTVAALCAGIAGELNAPAGDAQTLLLASALHDLGEIYINPEYLHRQGHLSPREWKHVATHPHVGQLLIGNLTSLPKSVLACVGQHHERHDGSGYPAQLSRQEQHPLAGWLAVADASSALISRGETCCNRVSLALRIVPHEFDREAADVLIRGLQQLQYGLRTTLPPLGLDVAHRLLARIEAAGEQLGHLLLDNCPATILGKGERARTLLDNFAKSLRATGILDASSLPGEDFADPGLREEMVQIVREVTWRMRNLARNLHLSIENFGGDDLLARFHDVIDLLDGAAAPEASGAGG